MYRGAMLAVDVRRQHRGADGLSVMFPGFVEAMAGTCIALTTSTNLLTV